MSKWSLPTSAEIGGKAYAINTDFRDILDIIECLHDESEQMQTRMYVALNLFYGDFARVPQKSRQSAADYMMEFINGGETEEADRPSPKRIDWQQDEQIIVADANRVAGAEIRALPFLHWWTFLAYFRAIGEGQLSTVVGIREKLRRGQKLEKWEHEFYAENKSRVDFKQHYTAEETAERERLKNLLGE